MASNDPPGSSSQVVTETTLSVGKNGYSFEHAVQSVVWAMGINFLIALMKLAAWFVSRSPSMLSEALHSLGDGINSVALFLGIQLGSREPDKTHPYGYGLEANVWALAACMMLLAFSMLAIYEGSPISSPALEKNHIATRSWSTAGCRRSCPVFCRFDQYGPGYAAL